GSARAHHGCSGINRIAVRGQMEVVVFVRGVVRVRESDRDGATDLVSVADEGWRIGVGLHFIAEPVAPYAFEIGKGFGIGGHGMIQIVGGDWTSLCSKTAWSRRAPGDLTGAFLNNGIEDGEMVRIRVSGHGDVTGSVRRSIVSVVPPDAIPDFG